MRDEWARGFDCGAAVSSAVTAFFVGHVPWWGAILYGAWAFLLCRLSTWHIERRRRVA